MISFSDVHQAVRRQTLLSESKLRSLWGVACSLGGVGGDAAELGVCRGGVARLLATACPKRTVRLFDTFTGIPTASFDAEIDGHYPSEFAADLDEVKAYLADCPNVTYHPGLFPETAAGERFAVVHLDADLYASTVAGLAWFWPRLSPGGALVVDDVNWKFCRGVDRAIAEFFPFRGGARLEESAPNQLTVWKQ